MIHKKKILVVDADPDAEMKLKKLLEAKSFSSLFAGDAPSAFKVIELWRPHLILLDLVLPQMSGLGFLREIKRHPLHQSIPVVVLTDVLDLEVIYEALELGAIGYINKSEDTRELFSLMRESVSQSRTFEQTAIKPDYLRLRL